MRGRRCDRARLVALTDDAGGEQPRQRAEQPRLTALRGGQQHGVGQQGGVHRQQVEHAAVGGIEPGQLIAQHHPQSGRNGPGRLPVPAGHGPCAVDHDERVRVDERPGERLHEEGEPSAAVVHLIHHALTRRGTGQQVGQQLPHLAATQRLERQLVDQARPQRRRAERAVLRARGTLSRTGAGGGDQQEAVALQAPEQVVHQLDGGTVRPVQVVDGSAATACPPRPARTASRPRPRAEAAPSPDHPVPAAGPARP